MAVGRRLALPDPEGGIGGGLSAGKQRSSLAAARGLKSDGHQSSHGHGSGETWARSERSPRRQPSRSPDSKKTGSGGGGPADAPSSLRRGLGGKQMHGSVREARGVKSSNPHPAPQQQSSPSITVPKLNFATLGVGDGGAKEEARDVKPWLQGRPASHGSSVSVTSSVPSSSSGGGADRKSISPAAGGPLDTSILIEPPQRSPEDYGKPLMPAGRTLLPVPPSDGEIEPDSRPVLRTSGPKDWQQVLTVRISECADSVSCKSDELSGRLAGMRSLSVSWVCAHLLGCCVVRV